MDVFSGDFLFSFGAFSAREKKLHKFNKSKRLPVGVLADLNVYKHPVVV